MPSQLVSLTFEDLLTTSGIQGMKDQIVQVINDPQARSELVFAYLVEEVNQHSWRIPVGIQQLPGQYEISWTPPGASLPGAGFLLNGLASRLKELKILINQAGTALDHLLMEFDSEIQAFRDNVTDQLATIPFRVTVENINGTNHFNVTQITSMPHPQAIVGGITATLKNSHLSFTASSINSLEILAELLFPGMLDDNGNPQPAEVHFTQSGNRLTADATNLPVARLQGFKAQIDSMHLVFENGSILPASAVAGKFILDFLDHDVSGPSQISFSVTFGENSMVTYEAETPEGHALKKGPVLLRFAVIRVLTQPGAPADVTISGTLRLEGMNKPDGTPAMTTFDMTYSGGRFTFEGRDFIPVPIGFGTITFDKVTLIIDTASGDVITSEWTGSLQIPYFGQGSLGFEILFDSNNDSFSIHVANQGNIPLQHGDLSILLKPFSMTFNNGELDDITGHAELSIPLVTANNPMEANIIFTKHGSNTSLEIRVTNFHTPELAGSQLSFTKASVLYNNGIFISAEFTGTLRIPQVTGGSGAGFIMDVAGGGNEIRFSLDPDSAPHTFEFGPVIFQISNLSIIILNGVLTEFIGSGAMELPSVQDPFDFSFLYNNNVTPALYEFQITGLKSTLGNFEIEVINFHLNTQAGHTFRIDSDGRLWLPVFSGGDGLSYDLTIEDNSTYRIKTRAGGDLISFGGFNLSDADAEIDVQNGIIQNYSGSGNLQVPGIPSTISVLITYTGLNRTHAIALTAPVSDIPFFGGKLDINTFLLELEESAFSQGNATGRLWLPGTTGDTGLSFGIMVDNQGDYDLNVAGNNERLNIRVLELEIPDPGFLMQIRNGTLQSVSGTGKLIFPGIIPVSQFTVSFAITGTGDPVVYSWNLRIEDVEGTIAGFSLNFDLIDIHNDSYDNFSAEIVGKMHLPVFSEGLGLSFEGEIPDNNRYRIAVDQSEGVIAFGGFELSETNLALEVDSGELQNFSADARLLIPCFNETFGVEVEYEKQNSESKKELAISLPTGTPDLDLFGCEIKIDEFGIILLDEAFGSCSGKGSIKLPAVTGNGSIGFLFEMAEADAGRNYRIRLDSDPSNPAKLDFHALELAVHNFELEVRNSSFHELQASGKINIEALNNSSIDFALVSTAPANPGDPLSYVITGSGYAEIGGFSLQFNNVRIESQNNNFSAFASGQLSLPAFENGSLGFSIAFSNSGRDYDIVVSDNTHELTFGSFGLLLRGVALQVRNGSLDSITFTETTLRIPGVQEPVAVNIAYQRSDSQGRESLDISLASPVSVDFAGGNLTINPDFRLLILDGSFDSCTATGRLRLPGSTSPEGEGIRFNMMIEDGGNRFNLNLVGTPQENIIRFGPVELEFAAFSLLYENNRIEQASGNGNLTLPGFSAPVGFGISVDNSGAATRFKILVQNADIQISDFNLHFDHIELESVSPDFSFSSSGHVTLPVFDGGQMNFELDVESSNSYGFRIQGVGTTVNAGPLQLSDFNLNMQVDNGSVTDAAGSGKFAVQDFINNPVDINITFNHDNGTNERTLQFSTQGTATFNLNILDLTLNQLNFLIRNGSLVQSEISGEVTIPLFSGSPVAFGFSYTPPSYRVAISAPGTINAGPLALSNIDFMYERAANGSNTFTGTARLTFPGTSTPLTLNAGYDNNRLSLMALGSPTINLGGFSLTIDYAGFAIEKNTVSGSSELTHLNISGSLQIQACDNNFNTLAFRFHYDKSQGGNRYNILLNAPPDTTTLKLGPVSLALKEFNLLVENGNITNFSGDAGLSMEGFSNESGSPAVLNVLFGFNSGKYTIGLNTGSSQSFDIVIGGFKLKINSLQLSFTAVSMEYPFSFAGGLEIPGLKDEHDDQASIDITVQVDSGNNFTVISSSTAAFYIGNLKVSDLSVTIAKDGTDFKVEITGRLTIEGFEGSGKSISIEIEFMSDGSFRIRGEADPAVKLLDIPSVTRVYLSMIELSRLNNKWGFAVGGLIQNLVVIPGMDNLLPSELKLRSLELKENLGLDMGVKWPSGLSIDIGGNDGGDIMIPVNGKFGNAVTLDSLKLSYGSFSSDTIPIKMMFMGAAIKLGPVAATVDGLGLEMTIAKRDPYQNPGNFGVVDVDIEFLPPAGLGISLDTPVFTGGGYLFYDKQKGEYAGAVELSLKGMFSISAVGLINSKMPDGQPGTSVLFIMSVEFTPGIALGFGFFMSGIGGIIGIHRTMQVDKLRDGVRTGAIANILFPKNIVANISKIISDIREIFPVKRDQFIIGPMAAITWGVPTILRIDLGLAIEFSNPVRFGILGVLRVILPDAKTSLIRIQVAFLGMIDFEKKMLSFDASLFDSKVLTFGLEGDMALRLSWGDKKDFVLSVGGFHPRYNPPAHLMLPQMKRLTIKILSGNPRLTLTSYFAVTTNTVQFGAGIDFYFGISKFKVVGEFGFDVLFQFSPFYFIADARARLAVKVGSTTLLGISLEFSLEGPTPWRAKGTAKFKVLFITIKVKFDTSWGDRRETMLPDIEVMPLLFDALNEPQNWRSITGHTGVHGFRMRPVSSSEGLILIPNGHIEISQNIVPLKRKIEKFGQYQPKEFNRFEIADVKVGGNMVSNIDYIDEVFAPGNFLKVSDADKLKLPSFEKQAAGFRVGIASGGMKTGPGINRAVVYEQKLEDKDFPVQDLGASAAGLTANSSAFLMTHGAMRKSKLSNRLQLLINPAKVTLQEPGFAVVNADNLADTAAQNISYMQAHELAQTAGPAFQIIPTDILNP